MRSRMRRSRRRRGRHDERRAIQPRRRILSFTMTQGERQMVREKEKEGGREEEAQLSSVR